MSTAAAASRPRILFINNQGLASIGGGVTILRHVVADLAHDAAVTVMSYDAPGPAPDGVRQVTLPSPPQIGRLWRLAPLMRGHHLLHAVPRDEIAAADLVVAMDSHLGLLLPRVRPHRLLYMSLSCIPRQEWMRSRGIDAASVFAQYFWLERGLLRAADRVVASSELHARELRRYELLPGLQPLVLHPAFPAAPPLPRKPANGVVTILGMGRLDRVKNYTAVIDLATQLRSSPCRFVLAGDGPEASALRNRVAAAGVAAAFEFTGPVTDVPALLAQADLLIHPARYESFGIAVFEAMCAGVAPIGARGAITGYAEIVHDGVDACLVDFSRPVEAAAALRPLITDPVRRMALGDAARATAERLLAQDYTAGFRRAVTELLDRPARH